MKKMIRKAYIGMLRARKNRAAEEVATYLVENNNDFRNCSKYDLAQRIRKGKFSSEDLYKSIGQ